MTEAREPAEAGRLPTVSIAVPCYEMHGRGAECLEFGLARIAEQTVPPLEVVVADHSRDDAIERLCGAWADRVPLRYVRNPAKRGSSSANLNVALAHASGDLVKILCQDDFLAGPGALAHTARAFGPGAGWLVSAYAHTRDRVHLERPHLPRLNPDLALRNSIGTHSCLTIRNAPGLELFDERLIWLMDCEYYRRLYDRFGPPVVLDEITVVQLLWEGQVTNTYARGERLRADEARYVARKHRRAIAGLRDSLEPAGEAAPAR